MVTTHHGAKLATRIAGTVSKSIIATHQGLVGVKHKLAMAIFHSISDVISEEVHRSLDESFDTLLSSLPDDSPAHPLIKFMRQETGQLQAGAGISAVAGSILGSLAVIINNELAPGVQGMLASNPHQLPDPGLIAQMSAQGVVSEGTAVSNIAYQGIGSSWSLPMIQSAVTYPGAQDALQMYRMGLIGHGEFETWMQRQAMSPDAVAAYEGTAFLPITAADAALAYLRNTISQGDAQAIAAQTGVNADDFNILVENTGEPLGLEQLLEAYRRNFIDQATLEQGILQSRVRNEWIPTAEALAYSPMSVADAVNAVVQNQLDQSTAETYAQQNGLMAGMFQILLNTAGEPLSRTEMEQLYNRGEVTEGQVTQALSESRLKNKYNDLAFLLHTRLLDPSNLSDGVLHGTISQNDAIEQAMELGYSEASATSIVMAASNAKMFAYRSKVVETAAGLYEVNALSESDATTLIESMGFSDTETAIILESADLNREKRIQEAGINAVRSKYVGHHIAQDTAQSDLESIGVPAGEVAYLFQVWDIEKSADVKQMGPYDVAKAVAAGVMTLDQGTAYLVGIGYSQSDANILAQVAG